jgi:type IV pilus assembly protein PilB
MPDSGALVRRQLGALLVQKGLITAQQLEQALFEREATNRRLGEVLVEHGWIQPSMLARALADQHELEYVDLTRSKIDRSAARLLSEEHARRYAAVPVRLLSEDLVLVAVADPTNVVASDDLRVALGLNVRLAVASAPAVASAIGRIYLNELGVESYGDETGVNVAPAAEGGNVSGAAATAPAIDLVDKIVLAAIDDGASDLHFEPQDKELVVRARIDGVMRRLTTIPKNLQPAITTRLKVMGELDIAERRAPQDGRVSIRHHGRPVDLRIAVLPTTHGEKVVMRIMNRPGGRLGLEELGMAKDIEEMFARAIRQPYGAVLTVGPSGAGKTTTLYAALDVLNEEERSLVTIEDPVEYQMPGVNQIEVNSRSGLTFARGLRTILRSDPDVLLVGEIRDEETAQIAIQAAMTGHLVLTTLHTHNAAASIARLADMGVHPNLLATALNCIVAQRLARRLCVHCREAYQPTGAELVELGVAEARQNLRIYRPRGCPECSHTGYAGRVALYEMMAVTAPLRRLIRSGSTEEIVTAAVDEGMTTLRQDGMRLVLAGVSSLQEVRRVTGDWAS